MRLGVSTSFSHTSGREWAKKHKDLGLTSVVFPLNYLDGEEKIDEYAAAAKEAGLVIAEVGVWRNIVAADPAERAAAVEYAKGQLAMADRIGANCCVNVAGAIQGPRWDGPHKSNFSKEAWEATVASVQEIVDAVQPKHTKYSLEPMPWMIPSGPEEYLGLLQDIDRDCVGVHMDIINMINCPDRYFNQEEFLDRTFELLHGKILSCHIKDVNLRQEFTFQLQECACGEGQFNLEYYAELANRETPDMPMIIEHLTSDEAYIASVAYTADRLKAYM